VQIAQSSGGSSASGYCVPHVVQMKFGIDEV
jgi:hypothetical protein